MAKIKMEVDEENRERAKYAGMTIEEIQAAASAIRTQKTQSAEVAGNLSGKLTLFEEKGGHKAALKMAERITSLEPAECSDFMRAFDAYFDALGGNDQLDMFTQSEEANKNAASITSVSMPQSGKEPSIN